MYYQTRNLQPQSFRNNREDQIKNVKHGIVSSSHCTINSGVIFWITCLCKLAIWDHRGNSLERGCFNEKIGTTIIFVYLFQGLFIPLSYSISHMSFCQHNKILSLNNTKNECLLLKINPGVVINKHNICIENIQIHAINYLLRFE